MPAGLDPAEAIYAAAVLVVAYVVRGITGFGSALVAVPLLALILPLRVVVPTIVLLDYLASLSHGVHHRKAVRWAEVASILPPALLGLATALYIFQKADAELLRQALGVFVLGYALYSLLVPQGTGLGSRLWAGPLGFFAGLIGTLFGTGGPFTVIYLGLRGLTKNHFRGTIAVIFLLDGGSRVLGYIGSGFYGSHNLWLIAAGLPIMAAALFAGGHIHTRITPQGFKRAVAFVLIGSGLALLLR